MRLLFRCREASELEHTRSLATDFFESLGRLAWPFVLLFGCLLPLSAGLVSRANLTSDESLYIAEAFNLATERGLTYTTGEPVHHRPPLYPALLAVEFKVAGASLENAYWLPRLATLANVLLVFLLARQLFGGLAAAIAGLLAASSAYLNGLGTTLYLDGLETTFLLAAALVYSWAYERGHPLFYSLAGGLLGLAFLTKESAILLIPLPILFPLLIGKWPHWRTSLAWFAGFLLVAGWWWVWVYVQTGVIYQLGQLGDGAVQFVLGATSITAVALAVWLVRQRQDRLPRPNPTLQLVALLFFVAWAAVFLAGLEWHSWPHPRDYLSDVPSYFFHTFAPNVQPWPAIVLGWLWALVSTLRAERASALPVAIAGLFLPFALFVANRELSLRDMLPLVILSYVVLGGALAWMVSQGARLAHESGETGLRITALTVTFALVAAGSLPSLGRADRPQARSLDANWSNGQVEQVAAWLKANVEPNSPLMSTRLYYSHLYFLTAGAFPVYQLPTVLVDIDAGRPIPVERRSTLFRWEPLLPPNEPDDRWLYLTRYGSKGYYVGLAEQDLLRELRSQEIAYLVVSITDAGFSSPSLLPYLDSSAAFELVYSQQSTPRDETRIYRVNLEAIEPQAHPMRVTQSAYQGLVERLGGNEEELHTLLKRMNPAGFLVTAE